MRDQYIQLCCDFYNEHTPEDKLWFGRMYDQCQEEYEKENMCMYQWQFPLMVLKRQQEKIKELEGKLISVLDQQWIDIKNHKPDKGEKVLVFRPYAHREPYRDPNHKICTFAYEEVFINSHFEHKVTHWMPLTSPSLNTGTEQ